MKTNTSQYFKNLCICVCIAHVCATEFHYFIFRNNANEIKICKTKIMQFIMESVANTFWFFCIHLSTHKKTILQAYMQKQQKCNYTLIICKAILHVLHFPIFQKSMYMRMHCTCMCYAPKFIISYFEIMQTK